MAEQMRIKQDPEAGSPGVEDELEESTDLEFYSKDNDNYNRMYLARLPNYLWKAWSELDDDEEIQIGTIRQWGGPGDYKIQMRLRPDLPQHDLLPKEYNMEIVNGNVDNTFVFSEQDLPSYAAKNKERAAAIAQGIPAHLLRQQQLKAEAQPAERSRRGAPYVRKAIPKKTAIVGTIKHEVVCTPVKNAETDYLLGMSAIAKQIRERKVQIERRARPAGNEQGNDWEGFIRSSDTKATKAKKTDNKTARWPENQLLDEIARCFSEHKYWGIRAFRGKIPQPEAYIRECLEKIAVLHRSGPFANNWSLKPEYQSIMANKNLPEPANDAAAPKPTIDIDSDEEDEDVKMEDVVI